MINLVIFLSKIHNFDFKTLGLLKMLVGATLFCLVLYNLMYSFEVSDNWLAATSKNSERKPLSSTSFSEPSSRLITGSLKDAKMPTVSWPCA